MHARGRVVGLLTLALLAAAGCSPDASEPVVAPTPAASTPVVTPTPTPDQEDLDYAAAEQAYRTFRAEYNRVLRSGGAKSATRLMKQTAQGAYLKEFTAVVVAYDGTGSHDVGREALVWVRRGGYSPDEILISACEDGRDIDALYNGQRLPGEIRQVDLVVVKVGRSWRVDRGTGKKVSSCDGQ